jgi:lipoprotein NlpI
MRCGRHPLSGYAHSSRLLVPTDVDAPSRNEASTFLLIQRGVALREQGFHAAAREALKEALRIRTRPAEMRQLALVERGKVYVAEGKRAMARRDFERVLAENSTYPGIKAHLAALGD